jgi:hypothetical protein
MVEEPTSRRSDLERQITNLEAEKTFVDRNSYAEAQNGDRGRGGRRFIRWISQAISIIGLIYLVSSIILPTKVRKIENSDILLLAVLLLFNSGLIEKSSNFSIDGTKLQAKFKRIEAEQEQQKDELDKLQQKQIDLQREQLEILLEQQEEIRKIQERQRFAVKFVTRTVIDKFELEHLKRLESYERHKVPYLVKGKSNLYPLAKELRHICAIGFAGRHSNKSISKLLEALIMTPEHEQAITEYVYITEDGKQYLDLIKEFSLEQVVEAGENRQEEDTQK